MSWNEEEITFLAGTDLLPRRRVKFKAGSTTTPPEVVYAMAGEPGIGITQIRALSGEPVSVAIWNDGGSQEIEAGAAIAVMGVLYGADNGQVSSTPAGPALGYAKRAASGAGSILEMIPDPFAGDMPGGVQRAGAAQAAVATTGSTNTTPYGYASAAQADAITAQLAEIRATFIAMGVWKGSA